MNDRRHPTAEFELDQRVAARTGRDRFRTRIEVRGHVFSADEPPELGGTDLGPTPYDLLCAALGACTTITLRMYADRKEWPLELVEAKVEHTRQRAEQDSKDAQDTFTVTLRVEGELTDAQVARLAEIAGRCPVHRTLARGATINVVAPGQAKTGAGPNPADQPPA